MMYGLKTCKVVVLIGILLVVASAVDIKHVHVTFMNHLDVGFTLENIDVINEYFDTYFPKAVEATKECRLLGEANRYIYTTHPFLVSLYLDCPVNGPLHCPSPENKQQFLETVQKGDIAWQAFPHNGEPELGDSRLFLDGLKMSGDLAKTYNVTTPTVMSQRDVPGMTIGVIPLLRKAGMRAISVGVNTGASPPAVPSAFVWEEPNSGEQVLAMWHPHGYGGFWKSDCVVVEGSEHALCMAFQGDNRGPMSAVEAIGVLELVRAEFLGAHVRSSTFDTFIDELEKVQSSLPVIKDEIADTWIHGSQSDPFKTAATRAILREREACIVAGTCNPESTEMKNFTRFLIKLIEHTWGVDVKKYLNDWVNWSNDKFESARTGSNFLKVEHSWHGQRQWIDWTVSAANDVDPRFGSNIVNALNAIVPASPPSTEGHTQVDPGTVLKMKDYSVSFSPASGAIDSLTASGHVVADADHVLGLFMYQSYNQSDYDLMFNTYANMHPVEEWMKKDYGKEGIAQAVPSPLSQMWGPASVTVWKKDSADEVLIHLSMPESVIKFYGSPKEVWIKYEFEDKISVSISFFNKTPTRLPESLWFILNPIVESPGDWLMNKLDTLVSPLNVNKNGSIHLHAVSSVSYSKGGVDFDIKNVDAALVSPGSPWAFPGNRHQPDLVKGWSYNLFNNIWGTNYPMWYPFSGISPNMQYRFELKLSLS